MRILLVDSDTVSRRLLGLLLKRLEQPPPDVTQMPETATEAAHSLMLVAGTATRRRCIR